VPGAEDDLSRRCYQDLPTISPEKVSQDEFLCTSAEARENIAQYATRGIIDLTRLWKPEYLESVVEGHGVDEAIRPVGLMLAGTNPVALDTVAAQAMGYHELPIWTTYYAHQRGLGCNTIEQINICGIEWASFARAPAISLGPSRHEGAPL
jgi:uncharacterized protein (DUF362 family)